MAQEIKAVLFDYGNVLCLQHLKSDLELMAACVGAEIERVTNAYWEFRDDFDIGALSGKQYWSQIADRCKKKVTDEQLIKLIDLDNIGWSRPDHIMVEWANRIRKEGIATAIVSNMPTDIREYLRSVQWLPEFDHYSFSCEISSLKPDSKIYEHTLKAMNVDPGHALFIDDRLVNVNAAKALGMHSFVYSDHASFQEYLPALGLPALALNNSAAQPK